MEFVIGIVVLALLAAALNPLVVFVLRVAVITLAVTAVLPVSPMLLAGFLAEVILRPVRLRGASVAISIAGVVLLAVWAIREQSREAVSLDWVGLTLTAAFVIFRSMGLPLRPRFQIRVLQHPCGLASQINVFTRTFRLDSLTMQTGGHNVPHRSPAQNPKTVPAEHCRLTRLA